VDDVDGEAGVEDIEECVVEAEGGLLGGVGVVAFEFGEDEDDDAEERVHQQDDEGGDECLEEE
jgi:hypothetical protein